MKETKIFNNKDIIEHLLKLDVVSSHIKITKEQINKLLEGKILYVEDNQKLILIEPDLNKSEWEIQCEWEDAEDRVVRGY